MGQPPPSNPTWLRMMGCNVEAVQQRGGKPLLVLAVPLASILARQALYTLAYGYGTRWQLLPVLWLPLCVQPLIALAVLRVGFSGPWQEVENSRLLGIVHLLDAILHLVPVVWTCAQTTDSFPLARWGSQVYYIITLYFTTFLCMTATHYNTPGSAFRWELPWSTVLSTFIYNTMRCIDPIADTFLVTAGFRLANKQVCPFRGGPGSCAAHYAILSIMTVMTVCDCVAAYSLGAVTATIADVERRTRLVVRLELCGLAFEVVTTACGVLIVVFEMTSKAGITVDFVITCAVFTALGALWTAYLVLPARFKERLLTGARKITFTRACNRVTPAQTRPSTAMVEC